MQFCEKVNHPFSKSLLPRRDDTGNKGSFGTLLSICGARDMPGAALLSGQAALRCGVGLLALAGPESVRRAAAVVLPEAVQLPMEENREGLMTAEYYERSIAGYTRAKAILFGCGIGRGASVGGILTRLLNRDSRPMVIDADGLFALQQSNPRAVFDRPVVLTPHMGEMARLTGWDIPYIKEHRADCARALAREKNAVVVLKDHITLIAAPNGRTWLLEAPNSGMAKGGSGDVLAGCIASFLAQGLPAEQAACLGVWIHSRAGALAARKYGRTAMLPRDILESIPAAILELESPDTFCESNI